MDDDFKCDEYIYDDTYYEDISEIFSYESETQDEMLIRQNHNLKEELACTLKALADTKKELTISQNEKSNMEQDYKKMKTDFKTLSDCNRGNELAQLKNVIGGYRPRRLKDIGRSALPSRTSVRLLQKVLKVL